MSEFGNIKTADDGLNHFPVSSDMTIQQQLRQAVYQRPGH
jgi:hypothetical protein